MKLFKHTPEGVITGWLETNSEGYPDERTVECTDAQFSAPFNYRVDIALDGTKTVVANYDSDILAAAKKRKVEELSRRCAAAIVAGFPSTALGVTHTYPFKETDQANLNGSVVSSLIPGIPVDWSTPFWCVDDAGVWAFRLHTAAQIQQAGQDGKTHLLSCMNKNATKAAEAEAATSLTQLEALTWDS